MSSSQRERRGDCEAEIETCSQSSACESETIVLDLISRILGKGIQVYQVQCSKGVLLSPSRRCSSKASRGRRKGDKAQRVASRLQGAAAVEFNRAGREIVGGSKQLCDAALVRIVGAGTPAAHVKAFITSVSSGKPRPIVRAEEMSVSGVDSIACFRVIFGVLVVVHLRDFPSVMLLPFVEVSSMPRSLERTSVMQGASRRVGPCATGAEQRVAEVAAHNCPRDSLTQQSGPRKSHLKNGSGHT